MLLTIAISILVLVNVVFLIGFFKNKETRNKLLFQSTPSLFFWVFLVTASIVAKSIFSPNDAVLFGYDIVILGIIVTAITTFIMGISGSMVCLKKRNALYMSSSIVSLLMIVFPIGFFLFPFVSVYLIIQKQNEKKERKRLEKQKKKELKKELKKEHKKQQKHK